MIKATKNGDFSTKNVVDKYSRLNDYTSDSTYMTIEGAQEYKKNNTENNLMGKGIQKRIIWKTIEWAKEYKKE